MKKLILFASLAILACISACNDDTLDAVITVDSNFEDKTLDKWTAGFSGYASPTDSADLDTVAASSRLPRGLDTTRYSVKFATEGKKAFLFSYLKKRVSGFEPNTPYLLTFNIDLGSRLPATPDTSFSVNKIFIKAGASGNEPLTKLTNKTYAFNLNKGTGSQGGTDVAITGSVASGRTDTGYGITRLSNASQPFTVTANSAGVIWLFVGIEAMVHDSTTFFYDRITATIKEQ